MPTVVDVAADLAAEHADLDALVGPLSRDDWSRDTPSPGWTIADQIGHLGYFDRTAALAITDGERFKAEAEKMLESFESSDVDSTLDAPRAMAAADLLAWWRAGRTGLIEAAATLTDDTRLPWYGPDMGSKSFLTARLMETWAHGQDIADALEVDREPTDRLRHIAQLGVITRSWSYVNRGLEPNKTPVQVSLTAPSGVIWVWGDDDAPSTVTGSAEEFCQVTTQRRHAADTGLEAIGAAAVEWMEIAQAFAGDPTEGPKAGSFR